MKNVVICHCYGCAPDSNWFPWLRGELEKEGFVVRVPDFGQANVPDYHKWHGALESSLEGLQPDETILVGHSLGAALIPRFLGGWDKGPFKATFLVAAPFDNVGWKVLQPFFDNSDLASSAGSKMGKLTLINSDDDPYIPVDHADKYKDLFGGDIIVEHAMEHIWQSTYPRLKDLILST
ncbi:hypothetical protein COW94_05175 [Candidatus Peregrinibacteria bacterium CG22_combo_CG10-13_8_21_14_all_44_10]|nr:MAG: hypothetical protein AUK45_05090 [Candidatus Peregrinibacteria bacterium CG2_30_44_17]PIP65794.1 MAG: hypothetical protein COW94_05175 [Candidatus Peregrinibacteria bacterium CG22_combo_CG10-13_8_21_14_all_44_10]PIX80145.1 MAG: hypothetical protein COZ35_01700 [Candidatus Peregrinibacteria bacterium CG_4_10_14_3_um_filter_44_21]PJB88775.1 MAG: hypothetical protein CO082_03400 [Candidatus Peregrinibacteria bacterium CG_4_9_14_0_8_um_filter_44_15]